MFGNNERLEHKLSEHGGLRWAVVVLVAGVMGMLPAAASGAGWSNPKPVVPQGVLQGVSCASAAACIAVGDHVNGAGTHLTLAERWNGGSWAIQNTPSPTGAIDSYLYGVSCVSASACTAVGDYANGVGYVTLAERWNGSSWQIQSTPNPAGAQDSYLSGVSCASAGACTAVGEYTDAAGFIVTLAERWNGSSWQVQSTANTAATDSRLRSVSCASASACAAVGFTENSGGTEVTLAERWNGTGWQIQSTPNPTGAKGSVLTGVTCAPASTCTAVGYYQSSSAGQLALAERSNGTSWQVHSTPMPAGVRDSELDGVSCVGASVCSAVGNYATLAGEFALAERWSGTSWKLQSTPVPAGAKDVELNGVSCTSASACTAVGDYYTSTTRTTLAERWNGTSWAIQGTPTPAAGAPAGIGQIPRARVGLSNASR